MLFWTDVGITAATAWRLACIGPHTRHGFLEALLTWMWWGVALVAGTGLFLGVTGGFSAVGFFGGHLALLVIAMIGRRRFLADDWSTLKNHAGQAAKFFTHPGWERVLALLLLAVLAALMLIAALGEPAVMDAVTYRLPRIGHWLQVGHMGMIGATDERLDFVAVVPEVVEAWLLGGVAAGFKLTTVAQALGGIMMVGATIGLARQTGLSRGAALLAGALPLGMANTVVQFTAAQTDLFTTGLLATAFYLWIAALRRGEVSGPGALGAGLALGAKGTLFYLAPGAGLWVLWLVWQHRLTWPQWRQTLILGIAGGALFALPGFARNWQAYGSALGPEHWVKKHHQGFTSSAGLVEKIRLNLTASFTQNFEPQSQSTVWRAASESMAGALIGTLPAKDDYTLDGLDRRGRLTEIIARHEPDADAVSFGSLSLVLFTAGSFVALARWRKRETRLVVVWSAGVVVFLLFFHGMQQWHPYAFRYFVLVSPWVAVVSAWGIEQLGRGWRTVAWAFVLAATADVGWRITTHTHQAGWRTVAQPERSLGAFVSQRWREWSAQLAPAGAPLTLALAEERPLAAFYRQSPPREIIFRADAEAFATAEIFVRGAAGWVIVPAARFLGREGRVDARVWLFDGDEQNPFSLAAYRVLPAGAQPVPLLYRNHRTTTADACTCDLLVKTWSVEPVRFTLINPSRAATDFRLATPAGITRGQLSAGEKRTIELRLPADQVAQIQARFSTTGPAEVSTDLPSIALAP